MISPRLAFAAIAALALVAGAGPARAAVDAPAAATFREANESLRSGDLPKAVALYDQLAAAGHETASLDWNRAQAALARGATGEAMWALLRARELDPSDRAVTREIDRLREGANLDRAEIAPDPLAAVARFGRRFRLDLVALLLLAVSLAAHAAFRWRPESRRLVGIAWSTLAIGVAAAAVPVAGSLAHATGSVVTRGAALLDAASPTAQSVGTLREGEVVPILEASGDYVRIEDSSGARGWALTRDVRAIEARGGRAEVPTQPAGGT